MDIRVVISVGVAATAVWVAVVQPQSDLGLLRPDDGFTYMSSGETREKIKTLDLSSLPEQERPGPPLAKVDVTYENIDLAAGAAQITVRLLAEQILIKDLRLKNDLARPLVSDGQVSSRVQASRPATLELISVTKSGEFAHDSDPVDIRALLQTAAPGAAPVFARFSVPVQRGAMFPIDRAQVSAVFILDFPPEYVEPVRSGINIQTVTLGQLPQATRWAVGDYGSVHGWRPSSLVLYTFLLSLAPLCSIIALRSRPGHLDGNAWEVAAALIAVLALRQVLVPEQEAGTLTIIDFVLAAEVLVILLMHYGIDGSLRRRLLASLGVADRAEASVRAGVLGAIETENVRSADRCERGAGTFARAGVWALVIARVARSR
ncbi:hypothetical protein [Kribbella sp. NPDC051770]|uniref:hypothetical protein n=1 Tax=Kribbella sp. NPDC051770 TaxID=3155413 RepID=UPI00344AFDBA